MSSVHGLSIWKPFGTRRISISTSGPFGMSGETIFTLHVPVMSGIVGSATVLSVVGCVWTARVSAGAAFSLTNGCSCAAPLTPQSTQASRAIMV